MRFQAEGGGEVLLHLVDGAGIDLPSGAEARVGNGAWSQVGYDGLVALPSPESANAVVEARWGEARLCTARIVQARLARWPAPSEPLACTPAPRYALADADAAH